MKKREMDKFAKEIAKQELIQQNPSSSSEDKARSEQKIIELTNKICSGKNGLSDMMEIDVLVQQLISENKI